MRFLIMTRLFSEKSKNISEYERLFSEKVKNISEHEGLFSEKVKNISEHEGLFSLHPRFFSIHHPSFFYLYTHIHHSACFGASPLAALRKKWGQNWGKMAGKWMLSGAGNFWDETQINFGPVLVLEWGLEEAEGEGWERPQNNVKVKGLDLTLRCTLFKLMQKY